MDVRISFPGGAAVHAEVAGHVVPTDQPLRHGGGDTAPPPFDLFLASIGTCAGFYAVRFCQGREIDTSDLEVRLEAIRAPNGKRVESIVLHVTLPSDFPEKYRAALVRAIDQCAVKRHILEPPAFEINLTAPLAKTSLDDSQEAGQRIQLL